MNVTYVCSSPSVVPNSLNKLCCIAMYICTCVCGLFTAMYIVRLLRNNSLHNYVMLLFNHSNVYWMLAIYVLSYFKLSKSYHYVLYMTMFKGKCFMVDIESLILVKSFVELLID